MKIASLNYSLLEKRWEKSESPIKSIVIGKTKLYIHHSDGLLKSLDFSGNEEKIDFCTDFKENNDEIIIYKGGNVCCSGIKIQSNEHFSIDNHSVFVSRFFLNKHMFISFNKTLEEKCKSKLFPKITKTFFDNYIYVLHENGISAIDKNLKEVFSDEDPSIIDFQANENILITIHFLEENRFKIKIYSNFLLINSLEIENSIRDIFFGNENIIIVGNKTIIFDSVGKIKHENNDCYDFATIFTNENEEYLVASKNNELYFIHISTGILVKKEKFNHSITTNPIVKDKKMAICTNQGMHFFVEKQNVFE